MLSIRSLYETVFVLNLFFFLLAGLFNIVFKSWNRFFLACAISAAAVLILAGCHNGQRHRYCSGDSGLKPDPAAQQLRAG